MKTKTLLITLLSVLALSSCSNDNNENSLTENPQTQSTLANKWYLNTWKYNNASQTLNNCDKQGYIQFNSNGTFERKDYQFVSGNCLLEGNDNGTYVYSSSNHKITLSFMDPNNGAQTENLNNVELSNSKLIYTWDEDGNGIDEHKLEFIKN